MPAPTAILWQASEADGQFTLLGARGAGHAKAQGFTARGPTSGMACVLPPSTRLGMMHPPRNNRLPGGIGCFEVQRRRRQRRQLPSAPKAALHGPPRLWALQRAAGGATGACCGQAGRPNWWFFPQQHRTKASRLAHGSRVWGWQAACLPGWAPAGRRQCPRLPPPASEPGAASLPGWLGTCPHAPAQGRSSGGCWGGRGAPRARRQGEASRHPGRTPGLSKPHQVLTLTMVHSACCTSASQQPFTRTEGTSLAGTPARCLGGCS